MRCIKSDGSATTVEMRIYKSNCKNNRISCASQTKAYLPAITICIQRLY